MQLACTTMLLRLLAATWVAAATHAANGTSGVTARLASWNLYYKALDDPLGRRAILDALDAAGRGGSGAGLFDFLATVEAAGDTAAGGFPAWAKGSKALGALTPLSTKSGYEALGLWYDASRWANTYEAKGEFESGRPYLLAHFSPKMAAASKGLWVVAVHLPHFLDSGGGSGPKYGQVLADALAAAAAASGTPTDNVALVGDWNEFQWEDNPCAAPYYKPNCRALAAARMAPLWGDATGKYPGYFRGAARDVVPPASTTCCTKWAAGDRDTSGQAEWIFEFDHLFVVGDGVRLAPGTGAATVMPYAYPGVAAPCADDACTGENPPEGVTATAQGSWHRGWVVDLVVS